MNRDRNPKWRGIKSGPFHRIGDTYAHFFNPDHFLGRTAFDKPWLVPEPPANLSKDEDKYTIEVALPGYSKEDIEINLEEDTLSIRAEKIEEQEYKDQYLAREMHFDTVTRHFDLDDDIDREGITAKYEDGLLRIALPHNGSAQSSRKQVAIG